MMDFNRRIDSFVYLGEVISNFLGRNYSSNDPLYAALQESVQQACRMNSWFTPEFTELALGGWASNLRREELENWLRPYNAGLPTTITPRKVAVIMAGNIPLVGFHDFLSVLITGNTFTGRLASDDTELLPALSEILKSTDKEWEGSISFTKERLKGFDAVIATGSNNSAGYFNYYFSGVPNIIRRNRNGIAIISGEEDEEELMGLADDIFLYFGLGCRNVSKLYVPDGYDFQPMLRTFRKYIGFGTHHKWMNNHSYYRAVFMLNQIPAIDNGFVLMTENEAIDAPPAVIYYEYYHDWNQMLNRVTNLSDEIQVAVCRRRIPVPSCAPGRAQFPRLTDYADGIDTIRFLIS